MLSRGLPSLGAFFLKATVFFLLLLPLWLVVSPLYTRFLAGVASRALPFIPVVSLSNRTPPSGPARVTALQAQGNRIILISSSRFLLPGFWTVLVHGNTMILAALFLADPRLRLGQRLRPFAWALCSLFGWHVGHTLFLVKLVASSGILYDNGQAAGMVSAFDRDPANVFFQIFAPQLVPFALWALLLFQPLQWQERERAVGSAKQRVGQNDPCPCGSGKKYKRCCGK